MAGCIRGVSWTFCSQHETVDIGRDAHDRAMQSTAFNSELLDYAMTRKPSGRRVEAL